jgi:hypothetical protein
MIQVDRDGVTLFYIDANGNRVSHNYLEGQAYTDMLNIRDAQIGAATENTQAQANYNTALANAQINVNNGHADYPAPAKPLQKVVSDTGVVTFVSFSPPLADLIPLTNTLPSIVFTTAAPAAANKEDVMYNMILAMFRKMFPDA